MPKTKTENQSIFRYLPWILIVGGLIGLVASLVLSVEILNLAKNPHSAAVCDLNPIFSCSTVSTSDQAEAFGVPNPFLGLAGYGAALAIGLGLLAGAKFRRWYWLSFQIGMTLAVLFIHWLIYQALYRIGALCLFCMFAWAATIPMFWYLTLYNLQAGNIRLPLKTDKINKFILRHHGDILILWFVLIIVLIGKRFWYYWSTLF